MSFVRPAGLCLEAPKGVPLSLRPLPEPTATVLVIDGPIACADLPRLGERMRVLLEGTDAGSVVCDVRALADPDAVTVDALARLQLTARRLGRQVRLRHASPELQELLAFMGLGEAMPLWAGLRLEPKRQTEEGEQSRGIQERVELDDPTV